MKTFVKRATSSLMVLIMSAGLTVTANAASISDTVQEPVEVEAVTASGDHQDTNSIAQAALQWGNGYASMVNNATMERYAYVYIDVYKSGSGEYIDTFKNAGKIKFSKKKTAETNPYYAPNYNFEITAGIYNGPDPSYVLGWSTKKIYP